MKILVVGGTGYVGGAVTDILSGSGHQVRVYDALLYGKRVIGSRATLYMGT